MGTRSFASLATVACSLFRQTILRNFQSIRVHAPLHLKKVSSNFGARFVLADNRSGFRAELRKCSHFSFGIAETQLKTVRETLHANPGRPSNRLRFFHSR